MKTAILSKLRMILTIYYITYLNSRCRISNAAKLKIKTSVKRYLVLILLKIKATSIIFPIKPASKLHPMVLKIGIANARVIFMLSTVVF